MNDKSSIPALLRMALLSILLADGQIGAAPPAERQSVADEAVQSLKLDDPALQRRLAGLVLETLELSPELSLADQARSQIVTSLTATFSMSLDALQRDPDAYEKSFRAYLNRLKPRLRTLQSSAFERDPDAVRLEFRQLFDEADDAIVALSKRYPGMLLDPFQKETKRPADDVFAESVRQFLAKVERGNEARLGDFLAIAENGSRFHLSAAQQDELKRGLQSLFVHRGVVVYRGPEQLAETYSLLRALARGDRDLLLPSDEKLAKRFGQAYVMFAMRHDLVPTIPPHWGQVPARVLNGDDLLDSDQRRMLRPSRPRFSAVQLGNLDQALGVWTVVIRRHVEVHDFVGDEIIGELLGESWLKKATQLAELEGRKRDADFQWSELEQKLLATWRIAYQQVPMIVEAPKLSHAEYQAKLRQWHEQFDEFLSAVVAGSKGEDFPEEWMRDCAEPHRVLLQDVQAWLDERQANESTDAKWLAFALGVRARILLNYVDVDQVKRHPNRIRGQNRILYYLLQPLDEDATSYKGWIAREQPLPDNLPADLKPVAEAFQRYVQIAKRTNPIFESLDHSVSGDDLAQRQYKHMMTARGDEERAAHEAVVAALDVAFVQRWAASSKTNSDSAKSNVPPPAIKEQPNAPSGASEIPATTPDSSRDIPRPGPSLQGAPKGPLALSPDERRQLEGNRRAKFFQSYWGFIAALIVAALSLVFWWQRQSPLK